jgi:hypothetical protein
VPVRLVVSADPGTEVFVIDHAFRLRARGLGGVEADVRPGLYKIKYRTGSLIREEHQVVPPGPSPVRVVAPPMPFTSVVPLRGTGKSYEAQEVAAQNLSREVHLRRGQGSEVFVFVRRWSSTEPPGLEDQKAPPTPAQGLSLHDLGGDLVADLEQLADGRNGPLAYAGCTVAVDPAAYRLRLQSPNWGALEQIVVASEGWQTQVFLPAPARGSHDGPADLARTAMLHAPLGRGFVPTRDDLFLTELARIALANQRTALTPQDLSRMLDGKFENPMLGIFGAHALLMADAPDRELLLQVVDNLTELLGYHPDVAALRLAAGDDPGHRTFPTPPMLLSSWRFVLKAAIDAPTMVPSRSLAARVSPYLWGSGPWLIWEGDAPEEQEEDEEAGVGGAAAVSTVRQIARDLPPKSESISDLTDVEAALLSYAAQAQRREGPTPASDPSPGPGDPAPLEKQMAQALGVPPAQVNIIAGRVVSKLADTAEADDESDQSEPDG